MLICLSTCNACIEDTGASKPTPFSIYGLVHEAVKLLSEPADATCLCNEPWQQIPGDCYLLFLTILSCSPVRMSDPSA